MANKNTIKQTELDMGEEITEEVVVAPKKSAPAKKAPKKYAPSDLIECRSVTGGQLIMVGPKTKFQYQWEDYNDITEVEYQDLLALQSRKSGFLVKPRFIIEDEELVEQWGKDFGDIYKNIEDIDAEDLLKLPVAQLKSKLKKASKGVQLAVKNIAGDKILNGSLDSLAKIKAIDEILGTDLKLYIK